MKKILITFIIAILCSGLFANNLHVFENDGMRAEIDITDGSLVSLKNKKTGWNIIPENVGRSFEMFLNNGRGMTYWVKGEDQTQPECKISSNSIVFVWKNLKVAGRGKTFDIEFAATVRFTDEQGLVFSGSVNNNSGYTIETLAWPMIGRVSVPDRQDKLKFTTVTYSRLNILDMYPNSNFNRANSNLPEQAFALIGNDREGLFAASDDKDITEFIQYQSSAVLTDKFYENLGKANAKTNVVLRNSGMEYDARANRRLYLRSGESRTIVPFYIKTYQGTWHKGADIYKAWKATWYEAPHRPEWVTKVNAWQQLQINSAESKINFTVKDLINYAKECVEYGVDAIQLTGWNWGGQDRGVPYLSIDPRLGTMEEFKAAIAECAKLGVRILPFTKETWVDFQSPVADKYTESGVKKYNGTDAIHGGYSYYTATQLTGLNNRRFKVLCLDDNKCREMLYEEFKKLLELGAFGMVYDENQHHAGQSLCFDSSHSHRYPGYLYGGAEKLGKGFYEMTRKYSPDFLMVGEACWDLQSKYYATYTRQNPSHFAAMRYLNPDLPMSCAIMDHNDLNRVNMCLRCRYIVSYEPRNFKGHLSEYPRVVEYGKKMDEFRERYADYVWYAEFRDTQGAKVEGKNTLHSVFVGRDGKRAVVVVNLSNTETTTAKVMLDTPTTGKLVMASPLNPDTVIFDGSAEIGPQGAIVIMEQ